jgi:Polymer-forming cytoskeletal
MSSFKHQEQLHDTPHAQACGSAPDSTKLELNNPKARSRSLIDKLANVTGDLWSDGDIQIDGRLCGNVNCAQLILGKDAAVIGAIIAQEAVIRGKDDRNDPRNARAFAGERARGKRNHLSIIVGGRRRQPRGYLPPESKPLRRGAPGSPAHGRTATARDTDPG